MVCVVNYASIKNLDAVSGDRHCGGMKISLVLSWVMVASVGVAACAGERSSPGAELNAVVRRDTAMIDSVPSCSVCSIAVVDSLPIGSAKDALIPMRVPGFQRDSRGRHYLTFEGWSSQPVLAYDSLGRYQGEIGHYGQGPGEYRTTSVVRISNSDSLFVYAGFHLGHVFSPDGKYARRADV